VCLLATEKRCCKSFHVALWVMSLQCDVSSISKRTQNKKKLSTMMRLSPFLAAIGVLVTLESGNGAIFGGSSVSTPRRWALGTRNQSSFGLARNLARGGAQAQVPYVTVEDSGEEEPVELYLPGLLEATISRTKKVG
jgi:hypothetical protein